MTMHPNETVYLKTNVKSPGFSAKPIQAELEIEYDDVLFVRESGTPSAIQDSYTRLILDVCCGRQGHFASVNELRRSWEILTPVLQQLEGTTPLSYKLGSRGPAAVNNFVATKSGYVRNEDYVYYDGSIARKTDGAESILGDVKKVDEQDLCDVGLFGLAVMGQNFALNMASHGFKVCVGNRSINKVHDTVERAKKEGNLPLVGSDSAAHFVAQLRKPRKMIILVQAGKPVDDTIATLSKFLEPGDIIVDGGNEWYPNSIRRAKMLEPKGIHFIGMGISGGEEGARNGPSLMPGGPREAYEHMAPILTACAAQVPKTGPCAGYLGPIGSGNYVKMVHNGIEYGDMQLIAEVYDILKVSLQLSTTDIKLRLNLS
jgi:6-phosphogluconate dehydrogenase (decarboxylating)